MADPMGLGKTLTMIALVATDAATRTQQDCLPGRTMIEGREYSDSTLIVVPPPRELYYQYADLGGTGHTCKPSPLRRFRHSHNRRCNIMLIKKLVLGTWQEQMNE